MRGVVATAGGAAITLEGEAEGVWEGPWIVPGAGFDDVIVSWNAVTPPGTLVRVELQVATPEGETSSWYVMGLWAFDDAEFERASVPGQGDAFGRVDTDTFVGRRPLATYRVRLTLRAVGAGVPIVRAVTAIASTTAVEVPATSTPGVGRGVELAVPAYSQRIHTGEYPEYDGGGASWCSPTSTAMITAFWGTGPTAAELSWLSSEIADPWVDHAARYTYDYAYRGAGNWPFNTAYAATFGLDAFVTRLRGLAEAEEFLRAGIPVVASIAAQPGVLDGFPLAGGTAGHLLAIVGCTRDGHPIVNDPAAESNEEVRRVYDRAQFERAWLGGSRGVVYVIRPPDVPLPASRGNW